jgi:hypothetical protein
MQRIRAAAGLLASVGLMAAVVAPVAAEPVPPTLTIETSVSHYLGGWWEQWIDVDVTCDGFGTQTVTIDLPGATDDILQQFGGVPAGTACSVAITQWSDPGENADWDSETWTPDWSFTLAEGANVIQLDLPRTWNDGWYPPDDAWSEHLLQLSVDRVYLNGKGGIEVEGTSWCPEAADVLSADPGAMAFANANWSAIQYIGRKAALHAEWASAIAHACWDGADPSHGPYAWQTRYAYPSGALQWVYAWDGKFGSGTIHVEAVGNTELFAVAQNFAPDGWTSYEGWYVPYAAECEDSNGDGWCVTHHVWSGWAGADLKPIRVK